MTRRSGFTLVELLVYVGMVSVALVVFMNFMIGIFGNASRADASQQLAETGRLMMAKMTQASRSATGFDPASDFLNDPGKVVLLTPNGITTYDVDSGRLRENTEPLNSPAVEVTSFKPEQVGNTLKISLTLASTAESNTPQPLVLETVLTPRQTMY